MADQPSNASRPQAAPAAKPAAKPAAIPAAKGAVPAAAGAQATGGSRRAPIEFEEAGASHPWMHGLLRQTPGWLVSMVVHIVILLVLALLTLPAAVTDQLQQLVIAPGESHDLVELKKLEDEPPEIIDVAWTDVVPFESKMGPEDFKPGAIDEPPAPVDIPEFGLDKPRRNGLLAPIGPYTGGPLSGRGPAKRRWVASEGGSGPSERAVALALKWLASHQLPDGGWSFNHALCANCRGQCRNPGEMAQARIAATGMALLPFLGAGQTHKDGKYKETVKRGLYFLVNQMKVSPQGRSLWEDGGRMYSHGIASIVLCEAYAMTHDKGLYAPAQQAINFICYAQDPVGGGWRYSPRQKGDTSVVGWQIMALKSGHMAYLRIPPITVKKAFVYLDTVQANSGANYGYTDPGSGQATTAIGLLCRMYLGWKKENPALERGIKWVSTQGPSKGNMYYNYYATQLMRHREGDPWTKWNSVMRDQLVNSQAQKGHETGSWHMGAGGDHGAKSGGRLYCTSMATMVLEVYYRLLPVYRKQSTEEDFPLD